MKLKIIILLFLAIHTAQAQKTFRWLVQPVFKRANNYAGGFATATGQNGGVLIDSEGAKVVVLHGNRFVGREVDNGRIFYRKDIYGSGDCSLYNARTKNVDNNIVYESASPFSSGLAIVKKEGVVSIIDESGTTVSKISNELKDALFLAYSDGMATFYVGRLGNELWGAINRKGAIIIKPKYNYISSFNGGLAAFQSGHYWGVLNKSGQVVLAPKYDWIKGFSDDYAVVRLGKQYGYIDDMGKKVIPITYKHAHSFTQGLAAVENSQGLWGFIDKKNNYVIRPQFAQAFSFYEGLARVENAAGKIGYIDKSGKLVIDYQFDDGRDLSEGKIAVKKGGKWGYIELLNPPKNIKQERIKISQQAKPIGKKLKSGKGILVTGEDIQLEVFDFEDEDGDSISLFFNGHPILEHYLLTNTPIKLKIKLDTTQENKLVLHAHNLGQKPPNTAAIRIIDNHKKVQRIELISDLANSDVLYFFNHKKDVSGQVDFSISFGDVDEKFNMFIAQLPKKETLLFKGSRLRKDIKSGFILYDNQLKKSYLCKDEKGKRIAYREPLSKKVKLDRVDGKYKVLDYICRKAMVTIDGVETEVYYTTELPFSYSPFEGIPGVVLQYSEKTRMGIKTVTAIKVSFAEMDSSLFDINGYDLQPGK